MTNTCKTCVWLTVKPDKLGRRIVRKDKTYRCSCPLPEVRLPLSVTEHFSFNWPPRRTSMVGDEKGCPCHEGLSDG